MTTLASAKQWLLQSKLGSCWKCMGFAAAMLVISVAAFVVTVRWQDLEGKDSVAMTRFAIGAALISTCAFALLCIAHLVSLVLRKSLWRE